MTPVFTDAGKVADFIIQRGRIGFEAFTADEKVAGMFETLHRAATHLRELAAAPALTGFDVKVYCASKARHAICLQSDPELRGTNDAGLDAPQKPARP